jgi:hypothetical protein
MKKKKLWRTIILAIVSITIALTFIACSDDDPDNPKGQKSSLSGKVAFANPASSGRITVYLERTDGLYAESVQAQVSTARSIGGSGAISVVANADGSYAFDNVYEGIYTIYATSDDKTEQAVLINIPVEEGKETAVGQMNLVPVGSIKGWVKLDGSENNNLGFTVFIAGTSYAAITNSSGYFEISNIPAATGYGIAVMRGNFATIWTTAIVESEASTELGQFEVTTSQLNGDSIIWRGALSSHPANPQINWSYYNTTDRRTYVYDGTQWLVVSQVLTLSWVVYQSTEHTSGNPPTDPNPDGGYVFGAIMIVQGSGSLVREGYHFGGWLHVSSGKIYQEGEHFIMAANPVVFTIIWLKQHMLIFDGNGNTSGTVPESIKGPGGMQVTIPGPGDLQKTGYEFVAWTTRPNPGHSTVRLREGNIITMEAYTVFWHGNYDQILYAVWE